MTGQLIGMIILWLIIAVIVIAVVVWLLNWLYHRSTKDMSFVRTGLGGEKVVINGGALVLPIIHEVTPVTMSVHRLRVTREKEQALITRDRMRVDIDADFYVRVRPTTEGVSMAASTLGRRMMQEDGLNELLEGKFVSVLRAVAAEMSLDEMHERRAAFVGEDLGDEGLRAHVGQAFVLAHVSHRLRVGVARARCGDGVPRHLADPEREQHREHDADRGRALNDRAPDR